MTINGEKPVLVFGRAYSKLLVNGSIILDHNTYVR